MNYQPEIKASEEQQKEKNRRVSFGHVFLLFVVLILAVTITALSTFSYTINKFCHVTDENAAKLQTITQLMEENSYYSLSYDEMLEAAIKAYVGASGDRYTAYYNQEEFSSLIQSNQGNFTGIGVTVQEATIEHLGETLSVLKISKVYENSPAADSGMKPGDYIYAVASEKGAVRVNDIGSELAGNMIRGEEGAAVKLYWLSAENGKFVQREAELIRTAIATVSVEHTISATRPDVGIVAIHQFDLTTPSQLCSALDALKAQGIARIVLDLRNNGGGNLISVIACASYFLTPGDAIITTENNVKQQQTYRAVRRAYSDSYQACSVYDEDIGKYRDLDVAVLVNEHTASAAELLTAVFRDYELATVIGEKTFGKGSMQTHISLSQYGLEGGLVITTNLYYPPCGEGYNGIGITPDIVVDVEKAVDSVMIPEAEDLQLQEAIRQLTQS